MRLDKYLKVSRIIKRRTVANEVCDAGRVVVNGKVARASYDVKQGDVIEIAIGTNTTAFVMGEKFNIGAKLPILIAEKTGPHFAIGDTCYKRSEDHKVYNRDGKEIIARDNEVSILRKTEPEKAYFNCHTDITIPYGEIGEISSLKKDGSKTLLIQNGRFVLPGTEELNKPLEEYAAAQK